MRRALRRLVVKEWTLLLFWLTGITKSGSRTQLVNPRFYHFTNGGSRSNYSSTVSANTVPNLTLVNNATPLESMLKLPSYAQKSISTRVILNVTQPDPIHLSTNIPYLKIIYLGVEFESSNLLFEPCKLLYNAAHIFMIRYGKEIIKREVTAI